MKNIILSIAMFLCIVSTTVANELAILFFTTPGCVPCAQMKVVTWNDFRIQEVIKEKNMKFYEINARQYPKVRLSWGVVAFPETIIIELDDDGKTVRVIDRIIGARTPKALLPRLQAVK